MFVSIDRRPNADTLAYTVNLTEQGMDKSTEFARLISNKHALPHCSLEQIANCENSGRDCRHCPPMPPEGLDAWLHQIGFYHRPRRSRRMSLEQIEQRFLSRINRRRNGCWIWTGLCDKNGFPLLHDGITNVLAHRWAYAHWRGPLARSRRTTRTCGNRLCVNPDHVSETASEPH